MKRKLESVSTENVEQNILFIRGRKVMVDRDLAQLYGVPTKALNQAVKRNLSRFPEDFMFQLTRVEFENWKSQFVTSNSERMGLRKRPFAFTEHGILMLSSVLNSERAVAVNIHIMRVFTRFRKFAVCCGDLEERINALEKKYNKKFRDIFEAIRLLLAVPPSPEVNKRPIGFHVR